MRETKERHGVKAHYNVQLAHLWKFTTRIIAVAAFCHHQPSSVWEQSSLVLDPFPFDRIPPQSKTLVPPPLSLSLSLLTICCLNAHLMLTFTTESSCMYLRSCPSTPYDRPSTSSCLYQRKSHLLSSITLSNSLMLGNSLRPIVLPTLLCFPRRSQSTVSFDARRLSIT